MTTFVVPDAHGSYALVEGLLRQEGLLDARDGVTVVQLGDLCNAVAASARDDLACLAAAPAWFDIYLVGNHEHPYFGGPAFAGYWGDGDVRRRLLEMRDRGFIRAAHVADDVLITHAGMTPWVRKQLDEPATAQEAGQAINGAWNHDPRHRVFCAIGASRGGWQREGGVLWADWSEPKLRSMRQLVGHSVGDRIRFRNAATCIDLGAGKYSDRIAGAWIVSGEIRTVIYQQEA